MSHVTSDYTVQSPSPHRSWKIALVVARFNMEVTSLVKASALNRLSSLGFKSDQIDVTDVAGSFEIPLIAKSYLQNGFNGVICIGAIIRGETTHYDLICNSVQQALTQLQLESQKPVVFGILTTENLAQAVARANGVHGDIGKSAAEIILESLHQLERIRQSGGRF